MMGNKYYKDYFTGEMFVLPIDGSRDSEIEPTHVMISFEEWRDTNAKRDAERRAKLTYAERRAEDYPSIEDQLDLLYHEGFDAWRAAIKAVKDANPKQGA